MNRELQMFKLDLEKAEEPKSKLPTSGGSWKKQESSRKTSASLTMLKSLTLWIIINCGKFFKRWESVQLLSHVQLFATPWTVAGQASLPFTISRSLLKFMSMELVMSSNHLVLCHPLLLLSIFPSIRVFFSESALHIKWLKVLEFQLQHLSFRWNLGLISFRIDWFDLLAV